MSEKYGEIMEEVKVTQEMRQRILKNIRTSDLKQTHKVVRFPAMKRYLSIAACFAVLLLGVLIGPKLLFHEPEPSPPVQVIPQIDAYASAAELSNAVGFDISDVTSLPFESSASNYTSYWGELGEITYTGDDNQSAVYRKSVGNEDNSGDYTSYDRVEDISIGSNTVALKGSGERYRLAWWSDGTYSYSLRLSSGVSKSDWNSIISGIG